MNKQQLTTDTTQTITLDGKTYPCYMTMGALMLYKRLRDKEMSDIVNPTPTEAVDIIFCITMASCMAHKIEFPYADPLELACHLTPDQLNAVKIQ